MTTRFLDVLAALSLLLFIATGGLWLSHPSSAHRWTFGARAGAHYELVPGPNELLVLHAGSQQAVGEMVVHRTDVSHLPYRSLLMGTAFVPLLWGVKRLTRSIRAQSLPLR